MAVLLRSQAMVLNTMASRGIRTFNLDLAVGQQIDRRAEAAGISKSELANRLLAEALAARAKQEMEIGKAVVQAGLGSATLGLLLVLAFLLV